MSFFPEFDAVEANCEDSREDTGYYVAREQGAKFTTYFDLSSQGGKNTVNLVATRQQVPPSGFD